MTPKECIRRSREAYAAGLIPYTTMERWIGYAVLAERSETTVDPGFALPFPWEIEDALEVEKCDSAS